ncbi:zinc ABC transporter substrate-binding protein [Thalassovita taeanensis]|uniref:High-affinity zinc uptake system protein ZnuA n=1 Tax=Thalassovita taeanensis TaxID=657014 RepID=A0A1H9D920_9RHOB|nr:zinc ABC transporter substrate-binding protein [Thalassovita taeanensis]SEQ09268.1 zinc transport system substrate-binding protein [Thalassovita taeanensis]
MHKRLLPLLALLATPLTATALMAEVPHVATDIPPVHSLVSQVMGDLGTPALIVRPGASPHDYALRPSEAAALERADLVVWIGHGLTPWLETPLQRLAATAHVIELMDTPGTRTLPYRETVVFSPDDHAEDHADDHDDHADEHMDEHADDDDHADDDHAHGHSGIDPHGWLDPENGRFWLSLIAQALSEADPENAATYAANAESARARLDATIAQIDITLAPVSTKPFVVFHDAFQYFEKRFHMTAAGAISLSDAAAPSPARIAAIRQAVQDHGVTCVFSEPQFNPGLVATVFDGTGAHTAVIDPLGTGLPLGPDLYTDLLTGLARTMADCL